MIIVNGETANIEVSSDANMTVSGNVVNMNISGATGATGPQGEPGTPALDRKFCIWKLRFDSNSAEYEVVNLVNNITDVTLTTAGSSIYIDAAFSEKPFAINFTNYENAGTNYFNTDFGYKIETPTMVFLSGETVSEWSYVIIEDLSIYLP